jgi:hypothetical protein
MLRPLTHDEYALLVVLGLWGVMIYFLPTCIAWVRRRKNTGSVFLFNLLAGWTVVGWGRRWSGRASRTYQTRDTGGGVAW